MILSVAKIFDAVPNADDEDSFIRVIRSERGQVFFRVVGDADQIWAGPDPEAFRQIAAAWNRYRDEVQRLRSEEAQLARVAQLRRELQELGALPIVLPSDPEPLWSLLLSEAELGMA